MEQIKALERLPTNKPGALYLDALVNDAMEGEYYTADGERVMLPLKALIEMGLVSEAASAKLKTLLSEWYEKNSGNREDD